MRKTSIFSREYEKKIRRKRFILLSLILIMLVSIVVYIINFSKINTYVKDRYYSIISKEISSTQDEVVQNTVDNSNDLSEVKPQEDTLNNNVIVIEENNSSNFQQEIDLNNNKVSILYTKDDQGNFEYIGLDDQFSENYSFDISPSRKKILIEDNITQDTYLVDEAFNIFKLDPEFFYSNSARSRFYKENIMSTYADYNWYKQAKFLDDNTIVYVSNLPWFGKDEEYIWRTDISNVNEIRHFMTSVGGQNIELGELTEQGIKVNINNEMKLLTFSFVLN